MKILLHVLHSGTKKMVGSGILSLNTKPHYVDSILCLNVSYPKETGYRDNDYNRDNCDTLSIGQEVPAISCRHWLHIDKESQ